MREVENLTVGASSKTGPPGTIKQRPTTHPGVEVTRPEGADYWIANARGTSRFFRFGRSEYELISLCDGNRTVSEIAAALGGRLARPVTPEALGPALARLTELGILQEEDNRADRMSTPLRLDSSSSNRQSALFFKLRAIDPSRLLDRLYPYVKPLLSAQAIAIYGALLATAMIAIILNLSQVSAEAGRQFGTQRLPKTLLTAYLVTTPFILVHEFAHAFTARKFGCRVREMGLLLIYFNFALYADVSEAWRLSRKKRIWVGFAGIALNLTVSAIALLLWLILDGSFAGDVLFVLAVYGAFLSVINLNPLIRLDGYYILADWLKVPNLRTHSFALVRQLLRGRFSALGELPPRLRRVYLIYGIAGTVYSIGLIAWTIFFVYRILGGNFGLTGQIVGAAVLLTLFLYSQFMARRRAPLSTREDRASPAVATTRPSTRADYRLANEGR